MDKPRLNQVKHLSVCIAIAARVVGCGKQSPPPAPGPLEVGVVIIATGPVLLTQDLPGRVNPFFIAQVDARVTHNSKGEPTAMVVGSDGKAEVRVLKTSRAVGNQWLVSEGLNPGDQLIVDNLQKLRPGMPVKPAPAKLPPEYLAAVEAPK